MDLEEHDDPDADQQQRVEPAAGTFLVEPSHQFRHQSRGVEWCGGLEDDAEHLAILTEGGHVVARGLVAAAVSGIFLAVDQQIAVQLPDVALSQRDVRP